MKTKKKKDTYQRKKRLSFDDKTESCYAKVIVIGLLIVAVVIMVMQKRNSKEQYLNSDEYRQINNVIYSVQ